MSELDPLPDFRAALEHVLRERAGRPSAEVMPDFRAALDRELRRRAMRASFAEVVPDFRAALEAELRRRANEPAADVMSDFLAALEEDLRRRAWESATAPRRRGVHWPVLQWRRRVFATALAVCLLAQAILVSAPVVHETPAFGSPPILESPVIDTPGDLARRGILGTLQTTTTETRVIRAFDEDAYLVHGGDYWCLFLYAPDGSATPEPVASCAHTATLFQIGLSVWVGHRYLAVLAGEVPAPRVKHADGTTATLQPTNQGVVADDDMQPGDRVTLYGIDGRTRVDRNG